MGKKVKKCANSSLKEAWVSLKGSPSPERDKQLRDKASALVHNIRIKVLEPKNTEYQDIQRSLIPFTDVPREGVLPYWDTEFRWSDGKAKKVLRAGNNFLGFHTLHDDENQKYDSYISDLRPLIEETTSKIDESNSFEVQQLVFSYINIFYFDYEVFNLSDYFDIACAIKLDNELIPLNGLLAGFNFENPQGDVILNLEFKIQPTDVKMVLVVETSGSKKLSNNRAVGDPLLLNEIEILKNQAKDAFFSCAKDKTKQILEVEYE